MHDPVLVVQKQVLDMTDDTVVATDGAVVRFFEGSQHGLAP